MRPVALCRAILRNARGAATLEFALAIPVLATLMIGILQFGIVMHTSGALRHAMGEGLRYAKVNPGASAAQVEAETRNSLAGVDMSGLTQVAFTRGTQNGARFGRLTVTYRARPVVPFVPAQIITLNETRQAYLQN